MIAIKANITLKDIIRYTCYDFYTNIGRIIIQALILIATVLWLYQESFTSYVDPRINMFSWIGIIYMYMLIPIRLYLKARKIYKSTKEFHHPLQYEFDDELIKVTSVTHEHSHKWDILYKVTETKWWFSFYFNQLTTSFIPKAAFLNEEQIQEFRRLIASKKGIKQSLFNK